MKFQHFFDPATFTLTYVVYDETSCDAVIIDPVLDYDPQACTTSSASAEKVANYVRDNALRVHYILETHAHADHLSGAHLLRQDYFPDAKIAIGSQITAVQTTFKEVFNFGSWFKPDGSQFDRLLNDGEVVSAGTLSFKVIFTPGHTPACAGYLFEDHLFCGDTIFMPDFGTGRCDFPAGSASDLYDSITNKIYKLPDSTRILVGHDYPDGRDLSFETTVGEQKKSNIQLKESTSKEEFVEFRSARDKTLRAPKLLFQSVQVNITAGELPKAESNGRVYLKMPMNLFVK